MRFAYYKIDISEFTEDYDLENATILVYAEYVGNVHILPYTNTYREHEYFFRVGDIKSNNPYIELRFTSTVNAQERETDKSELLFQKYRYVIIPGDVQATSLSDSQLENYNEVKSHFNIAN